MHDNGWRYHPAARFALLVAAGIATARFAGLTPSPLLLLLTLFLLLAVVASKRHPRTFALSLALVVTVVGALLYATRGPDAPVLPEGTRLERVDIRAHIVEEPRQITGGWRLRCRAVSLSLRNEQVDLDRDILVRVFDTTLLRDDLPELGRHLLMRGTLTQPTTPTFPRSFDYGAWLAEEEIAGILTLRRAADITPISGYAEAGTFDAVAGAFRRSVRTFATEHVGGPEAGIVVALLTGDRTMIAKEDRRHFSITGTAHVLALSGLHVGVLSLAIFVLLSWIPHRFVRLVLFSALLIGYATLTGGSPSIVRATLMAIFFLIAYTTGRRSRPLNTLALAGLVLLLFDPSALFDVGFQLSFAAVGGIILFYRRFDAFVAARMPILFRFVLTQRATQMLMLTIAAQIGTLPLTIYYFDGMPLISPLVNLAVVPLISIGFGSALAGYLAGFWPLLSDWFGATAGLTLGATLDLVAYAGTITTTTLTTDLLGPVAVGIALLGLFLVGHAQTTGSLVARLLMLPVALLLVIEATPIERASAEKILLMPLTRTGGIALVTFENERRGDLRYAPAGRYDSAAAARIAGRVTEGWGLDTIVVHPLDRGNRFAGAGRRINRHGPEYLLDRRPILMSMTARRSVAVRKLGSESVLQIGMHATIGAPVVLRSDGNAYRLTGASRVEREQSIFEQRQQHEQKRRSRPDDQTEDFSRSG